MSRIRSLVIVLTFAALVMGAEEPTASVYSDKYIAREGLTNFFVKAETGQEVRVAYFGGSITAQAGYRVQTMDWFRNTWADARFVEINAAIGGTGSELGAFRLAKDVLIFKPDLVFIEFAVNDYGAAKADELKILCAMEGIVRQIIMANPRTDICLVYTITADMVAEIKGGSFPVSTLAHEKVAAHYGLPSINMGFDVIALEKQGRLVMADNADGITNVAVYSPVTAMPLNKDWQIVFSKDGVHPYTSSGHIIYTEAIKRAFEKISEVGKPHEHVLKPAMNADNYEKAKMIDISDYAVGEGWYDYEWDGTILSSSMQKFMPNLVYTCLPDDSVEFQFIGRAFGLYDVMGPTSGRIACIVDGEVTGIISRFDKYCSYYRINSFVRHLEKDGLHTVKMTVANGLSLEEKAALLKERGTVMEDTAPYDDTCWHIGQLMLIGDIIEPMKPIRDEMGEEDELQTENNRID